MWLKFVEGGRRGEVVQVGSKPLSLGRDDACDIVLDDEKVSRTHARVSPTESGGLRVEDLRSSNGTFVDERRISGEVMLRGGERLRVGRSVLAVSRDEPARAGATVLESSRAPQPYVQPSPVIAGDAPSRPSPYTTPVPPLGAGGPTGRPTRAPARRIVPLLAAVVVVALVAGVVIFLVRRDSSPSVADIAEDASRSTLLISTDIEGVRQGTGTGWVLDADEGLIVTNHHVVNGGTGFSVGAGAGRRDAELVGAAPCEDLAVLRVGDTRGLRSMPLGSQEGLRQGDEVFVLGYPGNASIDDEISITSGVVSIVETTFDRDALDVPHLPNVVQTDSSINPGNSGGPLLDRDGRLVGVATAGINLLGGRVIEGQGYAIGVDRVRDVVADLREGESEAWAGFGLVFPAEDEDFEALGLPVVPGGIVVTHAVPLSPAIDAGFGVEPVILTSADGVTFDGTLPSYCDAVGQKRRGDSAEFHVVLADGAEGDISVEFG